ncbi:MAG: S26 family signal peptidase [Candidatus Saccharimonadales bacterium]
MVGASMLPTLRAGQVVVGVRLMGRAKPGMVVIARHNGLEKIKRVRQVRGGLVELRGDNSDESTDSRTFGLLPHSAILARVVWPRRL